MRLPRLSISAAMVLIVVLAADFGLVRQIVAGAGLSVLACLGVFFMANILAYRTLSVLIRQRPLSLFWKGFYWGGAMAAIGFVAWLWVDPYFARYVVLICSTTCAEFYLTTEFPHFIEVYSSVIFRMCLSMIIAACFAVPQLLSAILAGWLYRMLGNRRQAAPRI